MHARGSKSQKRGDLEAPGAGWAQQKGGVKMLCAAEELPEWYESSLNIKSGYRVGYDSCACAGSVFEVHNQTLNVWTHLAGGAYFFAEAVKRSRELASYAAADDDESFRERYGEATSADEASVVAFLVCATGMLLSSDTFTML